MNFSLIYSLVNIVIFIPIVYFSYRIVDNLSEEADAASAMFFLRDNSRKTFEYGAILVTFVLLGEISVFARYFYGPIMEAVGYSLLTVSSFGVLYFVRGVFLVTVSPSESEERSF